MKKILTFFLTVLISMTGTKAFAHDIAVLNTDNVPIYYQWINNNTELAVTDGTYSGHVVIPSQVTFGGSTYSVTKIREMAFWGCGGLTSVSIPNSVTSIGRNAFQYCSDLTFIISLNNTPPSCDSQFDTVDKSNCIVWVSKGSANAYKEANGWKDFLNIREFDTKQTSTVMGSGTWVSVLVPQR